MKYLLFMVLVVVATGFTVQGCSMTDNIRGEVYERSMKVFDDVEYRYHRKGNIIKRELMATGEEKIVPDDNLQLPTP